MKSLILNPLVLGLLVALALYILAEALKALAGLFVRGLRRRAERREQLRPIWPRPEMDRGRELLEQLRNKNASSLAKRTKKGPPPE